MTQVQALDRHEQLAAIADPRRLGILRMLMTRPATLTQIGERIDKHPAWVRHHVQVLLAARLVELVEERTVRNYTEKYYAATFGAFEAHLLVTPESAEPHTLVALGSHDLGLELLGSDVERAHVGLVSVPIGSLDGLIALRQGLCDVAGCHLFDDQLEEYNTPFLRHLFPDIPVTAVTLAYREQGLITAPGNPRGLQALADLAGGGARLANRNAGSGTRVWLDGRLRREGIAAEAIAGYDTSFGTHTAVAAAIAAGEADAGIGLRASAERFGLHFRPLFMERYDLVIRRDRLDEESVNVLLESLSSRRLKRSLGALAGYDASHTGEEALCA
ncbi:MAG: substrate-binding domain-containing protein [Coriobacteriia bacterium]|nr:substrate-binding domain-containing protein [Coriobacteriia bacterium]